MRVWWKNVTSVDTLNASRIQNLSNEFLCLILTDFQPYMFINNSKQKVLLKNVYTR